jgi:hypothetical protein
MVQTSKWRNVTTILDDLRDVYYSFYGGACMECIELEIAAWHIRGVKVSGGKRQRGFLSDCDQTHIPIKSLCSYVHIVPYHTMILHHTSYIFLMEGRHKDPAMGKIYSPMYLGCRYVPTCIYITGIATMMCYILHTVDRSVGMVHKHDDVE